MRAVFLVLAGFCMGFAGPARAADETNREIARTFANFHLQQKNLRPGWAVLRQHLESDPADVGAWNLLGLIYLEADQPSYAMKAFHNAIERGSTSDPERGIYLYNYADAANRAGRETQARDLLAQSAVHELSGAGAKLAMAELKSGAALPVLSLEAKSWSGSATVFSGYDSNVLLFSDSVVSGGTATGTASPAVSTILQARHSRAFASQPLEAAISTGFTYYQASESRKFNNLLSAIALDWGADNDELAVFDGSVGTQLDLSFMNTNGFQFFNWSEALQWRGKLRHSLRAETEFAIPFTYYKFRVEEGDDPEDDRSGLGLAPSLTHSRQFGSSRISGGLRVETLFSRGDNYRSYSLAIPVSVSRPVGAEWRLRALAEPQAASYSRSATGRRDRGIKFGLALARSFGSSFSATMDYSFRRNLSNVELATYAKHSLMLMVNYELF